MKLKRNLFYYSVKLIQHSTSAANVVPSNSCTGPSTSFNPIQDVLFRGCSRMGGTKRASLPKICRTYPTMIELGSYTLPKEDPKNI